jgi:CheY-like chemotaxis protein
MEASTIPFALVVDDEPMILMHASAILEDAGFRTLEAINGDEAKRLLVDHAESVILLFSDVDMPGETNGFALARHVEEAYPHIEIVIASGRVTPGPGDMPPKATFINKPFSEHSVVSHLAEKLPDGKKPEPLKRAV